MSVEIRNDNTPVVLAAMKAGIKNALDAVGAQCEAYAKDACPVGTPESTGIKGYRGGTLKNSITHQVDGDTVQVGTNVVYGKFVEMGTVHRRATPYLRPAAQDHADEYRQLFRSILG